MSHSLPSSPLVTLLSSLLFKIYEDDNIGNYSVSSSDKEESIHTTTSNKNDVVEKDTSIAPTLPICHCRQQQ